MKVYGPYTRKDGRKHVVIVHVNGKKQTMSYPKFLMEQHLGRSLENWETVDHKDEDFTNDNLDNLQILTRAENAKKGMKTESRKAKIGYFICPECFNSFEKRMNKVNNSQGTRGSFGPFCNKICSGKYYKRK